MFTTPKICVTPLIAIFLILKMVFFLGFLTSAQPKGVNYLVQAEFIFPDSVKSAKPANRDTTAENIYKKLKDQSEKNYFTRKLYGLFFRRQTVELAGRILKETNPLDQFEEFSNKKISSIEIVRLKPFGQSVHDTSLTPAFWFEKVGNSVHLPTSPYIVRSNLLFKVGDRLDPLELSESEQLIRQLPFIEDVNIYASADADTTAVTVLVVTKDKWSIAVSGQLENKSSGELQLYESNLGGMGLGLHASLFHDNEKPGMWGYMGEIRIPNILGSFVSSSVKSRGGLGYETQSVDLNRDFFATKTTYGGGVNLARFFEPYRFNYLDSAGSIGYNLFDAWAGRALTIHRKRESRNPFSLVLSFRYYDQRFAIRPQVTEYYNPGFHNRKLYLAGLSFSQQKLFKANMIYTFGPTEDIPTGFRILATYGKEYAEFKSRLYVGGELSAAEKGEWGYLFLSSRVGGYIAERKHIQQAVINLRSTYFTNLFVLGRLDIRQFVKFDYTRGFARFEGEGEYISLSRSHSIRGLYSNRLYGTSRFLINLETVAFSPLFVFGFRFAYYLFFDMGFVGPTTKGIFANDPYNGFGIGVRIRNENLVFQTFQLRLGYYPLVPNDASVSYFLFGSETNSSFEHFRARKPQILPFN